VNLFIYFILFIIIIIFFFFVGLADRSLDVELYIGSRDSGVRIARQRASQPRPVKFKFAPNSPFIFPHCENTRKLRARANAAPQVAQRVSNWSAKSHAQSLLKAKLTHVFLILSMRFVWSMWFVLAVLVVECDHFCRAFSRPNRVGGGMGRARFIFQGLLLHWFHV
jgi:hypothetical protein